MTGQNLRRLLEELHEELHNELQRAENVDEKGRVLLRHLEEDIRDLLQRSGDESVQGGETLLGRFQSAIDHFEVTHPKLTMALSEMMTSLSNAGI